MRPCHTVCQTSRKVDLLTASIIATNTLRQRTSNHVSHRGFTIHCWMQLLLLLNTWACFTLARSAGTIENVQIGKFVNCHLLAAKIPPQFYQRLCSQRRGNYFKDFKESEKMAPLAILGRYPLMDGERDPEIGATPWPPTEADGPVTGMWAVKLKFGLEDESRELLDLSADLIAHRHGLENHGQIGELRGYYLFTKKGADEAWTTIASAAASSSSEGVDESFTTTYDSTMAYTGGRDDYAAIEFDRAEPMWNGKRRIILNTQVEWQGQQELLSRSKRGYVVRSNGKSHQPNPRKHKVRSSLSISTLQGQYNNSRAATTAQQVNSTTFTVRSTAMPSTASPASSEEKSRHEFYLKLVNQYSKIATVTHHRDDVTHNPKYRDMVGSSGGGAGGRRMGVDSDDDDELENGDRWNSAKDRRPSMFSDPLYFRQWHLENLEDMEGTGDCNVTGVWKYGITGKGVVVAVVDDGVQWDHPDLIENYSPEGSFDLNANDDDPMPVRDDKEENKHGTRCAGEIAAAPNSHCGVGIAYGAKFSGIRILDGPLTDSMEAAAFNKHLDVNDIYSCSWGPEDDGKTVDGPHPLAQAALKHGIVTGRQGFGSIYIVASGNGGHKGDNCNYDGYANSIYTITVGAVDEFGRVPSYAEECASMLACTFSSGAGSEDGKARKIVTTDWTLGRNKKRISGCTESHTGTSAATPLAAGMVALMLEARPCLTWRDVQHIIVMTSLKILPEGDEWTTNTAGFHHSDKKGFGLLNAWRLVNAAIVWKPVPWLTSVTFECPDRRRVIPNMKSRALIVKTLVTQEQCNQNMVYTLEEVLVTVDIDHPHRGDLFISLVCPTGTTSIIGRPRKNDDSTSGLRNWVFATVKCWGEQPHGTYRLIIHDTVDRPRTSTGELRSWKLTLYGSTLTQQDVDEQRKRVEEAMSGTYLQPFSDSKRTLGAIGYRSNETSMNKELMVGYCPPLKKRLRGSGLILETAPTERTLKLIALSGCFLLLWGLYCIFDTAKLQGLLSNKSRTNANPLGTKKLKLFDYQILEKNTVNAKRSTMQP